MIPTEAFPGSCLQLPFAEIHCCNLSIRPNVMQVGAQAPNKGCDPSGFRIPKPRIVLTGSWGLPSNTGPHECFVGRRKEAFDGLDG